MLDGDLEPVAVADAGVDDAEAALAQHRPHLVGLLEGLPGRHRGGEGGAAAVVVVVAAPSGEDD